MVVNRIREYRERLGLTQEALARRVGPGTTAPMISRWEGGQVVPSLRMAFRLAAALQTTVDELFIPQ